MIQRAEQPEAQSQCELCGSLEAEVIGGNPDFPGTRVLGCETCGYMWTSPAPDQEELAARYKASYREARREGPTPEYLAFMDKRADAQFRFICQETGSAWEGRRVLDIGCGCGRLLKRFQSAGAETYGYEPDAAMAGQAAELLSPHGIVRNTLFTTRDVSGITFDLICMSHVVEHLPSPAVFLAALKNVAAPDGALFIEVPHETPTTVTKMCSLPSERLMHLIFLNAQTLKRLIGNAGWEAFALDFCGPSLRHWAVVRSRTAYIYRRVLSRVVGRHNPHLMELLVFSPSKLLENRLNSYRDNAIWIRTVFRPRNYIPVVSIDRPSKKDA